MRWGMLVASFLFLVTEKAETARLCALVGIGFGVLYVAACIPDRRP